VTLPSVEARGRWKERGEDGAELNRVPGSSRIIAATMALSTGTRLGPYEILAAVGAGGMGEVYKACDTRLNRIVAIKVLLPHFTSEPDSRHRFDREARAIAALSHPHICSIFDVGHQDGTGFLVMEYLDGETLAQRLGRGKLPVDQALRYAIEIADALAAAHKGGVVHRDLKPSNVILTSSGAKLLDFGLARMGGAATQHTATHIAQEPLTAAGMVLGTVQYMSPEQLAGRDADARSDIFSFGAVLYEMISGRQAFDLMTAGGLTTPIREDDRIVFSTVCPVGSSEALEHVVRTCLIKEPDARWQSARDLGIELRWIAAGLAHVRREDAFFRRNPRLVWIAATFLLLVIVAVLATRQFARAPDSARTVRSSLTPPEHSRFVSVGTNAGPAVLSPDGTAIVFTASSAERRMLLVRRLDSLAAQVVGGFWSPDASSIGFFADQKLKKVSPSGGSVVTLCDAPYGAGGSWSPSGVIVFGPTLSAPLHRVPAAGGTATPATTLAAERRERTHRWPSFLPDGRHFLYLSNEEAPPSRWSIRVGSLDSPDSHFVLEARSNAAYQDGYLLFVRDGTLLAQPFDPDRLKLVGDAVPLAERVRSDPLMGRSVFSVSAGSTLAYEIGGTEPGSRMVWIDRTTKERAAFGDPGPYSYSWPRISPDGKRVATAVTDPTGSRDIWIYEVADGRAMRLTLDAADEGNPLWMPDGRRLVFSSNGKGVRDIHWKAVGGGTPDVLLESGTDKYPQTVSPDGQTLIYTNDADGYDLWLLLLSNLRSSSFIAAPRNQTFARFSPNGSWLAYDSREGAGTPDGRSEVYVTKFPSGRGKWPVSRQGGIMPTWRRDGREIFYLSPDHHTLFAAEVIANGDDFQVTKVQSLFTTQAVAGVGYPYDVSADGNRFLFVTGVEETSSPLTLVVNWTAHLAR
jgi:serine/threonine protein kinase/Tol biopolymer transport system component